MHCFKLLPDPRSRVKQTLSETVRTWVEKQVVSGLKKSMETKRVRGGTSYSSCAQQGCFGQRFFFYLPLFSWKYVGKIIFFKNKKKKKGWIFHKNILLKGLKNSLSHNQYKPIHCKRMNLLNQKTLWAKWFSCFWKNTIVSIDPLKRIR